MAARLPGELGGATAADARDDGGRGGMGPDGQRPDADRPQRHDGAGVVVADEVGRFVYSIRGPDFLDATTGKRLELTTPSQVGGHLSRPGCGRVTMCTYTPGAWSSRYAVSGIGAG